MPREIKGRIIDGVELLSIGATACDMMGISSLGRKHDRFRPAQCSIRQCFAPGSLEFFPISEAPESRVVSTTRETPKLNRDSRFVCHSFGIKSVNTCAVLPPLWLPPLAPLQLHSLARSLGSRFFSRSAVVPPSPAAPMTLSPAINRGRPASSPKERTAFSHTRRTPRKAM